MGEINILLQAFSVRFILADSYLEFVGHFPNPSDMRLGWGMAINLRLCPFVAWQDSWEADMQAVVKGTSEISKYVLIRCCTKRLCHNLFAENTLCYKSTTYYFCACLKPASVFFPSYKGRQNL